jgi:hypothetical protein
LHGRPQSGWLQPHSSRVPVAIHLPIGSARAPLARGSAREATRTATQYNAPRSVSYRSWTGRIQGYETTLVMNGEAVPVEYECHIIGNFDSKTFFLSFYVPASAQSANLIKALADNYKPIMELCAAE